MRRDFVKQLVKEMELDKRIVFLTGDLGFNALEPLQKRFAGRFINVGIAEQHLMGMAAGLALEGKKVIAYSIASFATMRPYEQIRDDICYHNLDVKIVGTGGGYNYATHGVTHHTLEDIAIMRVLPHMRVLAPAYAWEAAEATKAMLKHHGPFYMRLGRSPNTDYKKRGFSYRIGRGFIVKNGRDLLLLSTGNMLDVTLKTAEVIEGATGASVCVISNPSIKPFDAALLLARAAKAKGVFTIEEHSTVGGLGSVVSSVLFEKGFRGTFGSFGLPPDKFIKAVGEREHLLKLAGLEPSQIAKKIIKKIL